MLLWRWVPWIRNIEEALQHCWFINSNLRNWTKLILGISNYFSRECDRTIFLTFSFLKFGYFSLTWPCFSPKRIKCTLIFQLLSDQKLSRNNSILYTFKKTFLIRLAYFQDLLLWRGDWDYRKLSQQNTWIFFFFFLSEFLRWGLMCVIFISFYFWTVVFIFIVVSCDKMFRLLYHPAFLSCPLFIWA